MPLTPGYGETPVDPEDLDALTDAARDVVGDAPTKADLYDLEATVLAEVSDELVERVADGVLGLDDLLADHFVRELHGKLYSAIWTWGGRFRTRELNSVEAASERWDLRPAEASPNVILFEPRKPDDVAFDRAVMSSKGYRIAAPAQVAADLLNGPGRNPSEAEELLVWMSANEGAWRK